MKRILHIATKIFLWLLLTLAGLILFAVIAIQFPAVQQKIIHAATGFVSDKTHTRVDIGRIVISFPKNIVLENVFVEDLQHDTLLSVTELSVGADLFALLSGKIVVSDVNLSGVISRIHRTLPDSAFNFDFLIQAFASPDKISESNEPAEPSEPLHLSVGKLNLANIQFTYDDEVSGIYTKNTIGALTLSIESIGLKRLSFVVDELYLGQTTSLVEVRTVSTTTTELPDTSRLPDFAAKKIVLEGVNFSFKMPNDSLVFTSIIGKLELQPNKVDLNKQQIDIRSLTLNHSDIQLEMQEQPTTSAKEETSSSDWSVSVNSVSLAQNAFAYHLTNLPKLVKGIDYNHIQATNIGLEARSVFYDSKQVKGDIKQLTIEEQSGISVQKMHTKFSYDGQHAELANLYVQTPRSRISNYLAVTYSSISAISKHPGDLGMNLHFKNTQIAMQDVLIFAPELESDPIIAKNTKQHIVLNGSIKGKLADLQLTDCIVQTASKTAIAVNGTITGLPDIKKVRVDATIPLFTTSRQDLDEMIPAILLPSSVEIPQQIFATGFVKGSLKDVKTQFDFHTSDGALKCIASYKLEDTVPYYRLKVEPSQLNVGAIINQPIVGKVTGNIEVEGHSFNPKEIVATATGKWSLVELNNYAYSGVEFKAAANEGSVQSQLLIKDENIDLTFNMDGYLQTPGSYANIDLILAGANLKELNLTPKEYHTSGELKATLSHILERKVRGNIGIGNVVVVKEQQRYQLDSLLAFSMNEQRKSETTDALLRVNYIGETQLRNLWPVMQQYMSHYWGNPKPISDSTQESFTCAVQLNPHPVLSNVFLPGLGQFYGMTLKADYTGQSRSMNVTANVPFIEYNQIIFKELQLKVKGGADSISYNTSVQSISGQDYFIDQTSLSGNIADHHLGYHLRIKHPDGGYKLNIAGDINQQGDSTVLQWVDDHIILNNQEWDVAKGNRIVVNTKGINIQQFNLKQGQQFVKVNSASRQADALLTIEFGNFSLEALSQIIEKDSAIVRGIMNGKIVLNPADKFAFTSNLNIRDIALNRVPVGNLSINADNEKGNQYNALIQLSGNGNDATVKGHYKDESLNFQLSIRQINVQSIEAFIPHTIKRSKGYLTGNVLIAGKADHPELNGELALKDASFNLSFLNSRLTFKDEHILLNKKGIQFNKFTVLDSMGQPLVIDGMIRTRNFVNMEFAVDITTKEFRVLNTTEKDNAEYYGTILLNSVIQVRGTEKLPKITADVKLIEGSDLTFVVKQGELTTDKGDGVVIFIGEVKATLKDTNTTRVSGFVGLDMNANIEVNKYTKFKIITDKVSGDNLTVSGDAVLNFGIDESGKMSLVGAYILSSGNYKASLQKVVKREFEIKKGSTITWSGDPIDAAIDITATYKARTGAADLMAAELAGVQEEERKKYRKLLNYDVNLIMKGFLLKPELTFNLDMPLKDQQALDGQVYAKINQINNDPNELNKQVFSLLIFGKFVPMGMGSNMSPSNAASSLARNSVNQLFSDQLNAISGKYIKGAELNFNIQSNDDYTSQGTQQSTEVQIGLKKELFNNRMSVQVGSNIDMGASASQSSAQTITGDMVMEYKITEDGAYRFKAFTENSYEGIIDGQLYKTGVGFLYSRDYDSISQLFARPKKEEELKLKEEQVD